MHPVAAGSQDHRTIECDVGRSGRCRSPGVDRRADRPGGTGGGRTFAGGRSVLGHACRAVGDILPIIRLITSGVLVEIALYKVQPKMQEMKRNKELVKKILLFFEAADWPHGDYDVQIDGFSKNEINFHVELLVEAGFIYRYETPPNEKAGASITQRLATMRSSHSSRLTWDGFEFLENAKNDTFWKTAMDKAGDLSFAVFAQVLSHIALVAAGVVI